MCATDQELEAHHRRYPEVLGTETVDGLTTLCRTCHHTATTDLRRRTYRLRRHDVTDTPRLTPGKVRMKVNVPELDGVAPLVTHNGQLADPLNRFTKEMKKVSGKRNKTDADHEELARVEFLGGLYLHQGEPCIPGEVLEAALIEGAKKHKKGPQAKAGIVCDGFYPLAYDGPRDPEALWQDPRFRLVAGVRIQKNRVMRTRPIFRGWSAGVEVSYLPDMLNEGDVRQFIETVGRAIGLGDWRPRFGRFEVVGG